MDEYSDKTAIKILSVLIIIGMIALGILLYRQNQQPPLVLEEVVETIELPESLQSNTKTPQVQE